MRTLISVLLLAASFASAQTGPLLLRKPALSASQIVFTYAGDLWSVPREGGRGQAADRRRPASRPMRRSRRMDGTIAFTGEYDGNVDVFIDSRGGRRAAAADVPSGARRSGGLDAGRQARAVRLAPRDAQRWRPAVHAAGRRRRTAGGTAAADRRGGFLLARRLAPGLRAAVPVAGSLEAVSGRADAQDLDRRPGGFERGPDSAREFERLQPDVGGRRGSTSSPTANGPVTLFYYDTNRKKVTQRHREPRARFQIGLGGAGRDRLRAVRLAAPLRSEDAARRSRSRSPLAGDLPELRPHYVNVGKRLHESRHLAQRRAGGVRGARRDHHGAGRKGRCAQPDATARR